MPRAAKSNAKTPMDAIALLKADHREVEAWFAQFEKARSDSRKVDLAAKICIALEVHTQIEEEIFYPAFLDAVEDRDLHHEAIVEHDAAKQLIAKIAAADPSDEFFDAKLKVLAEMIKHHVKEEEQRDGMFAAAKQSRLDLKALGQQLAERKAELMRTGGAAKSRSGRTKTRVSPRLAGNA
jgi:hemerythrin superfamily protein